MDLSSCNNRSYSREGCASLDSNIKKWNYPPKWEQSTLTGNSSHKSQTIPSNSESQKSPATIHNGGRSHYPQIRKHLNGLRTWANSGPLVTNMSRRIDSFQNQLRPIFRFFQVKTRRTKNSLSESQTNGCLAPKLTDNTEADPCITTISSVDVPGQKWPETASPDSCDARNTIGAISPDFFDTPIHELGDADYLGQWYPCQFGRVNSQPCFVDGERNETSETSRSNTSPFLWSGPTCASERISTWTFSGNHNLKFNSGGYVFLLGLLIQPATYIRTSGQIKYFIQIEPQKLFGLIRVKNLAFEKTVTVRCSADLWSTFTDHNAFYLPPLEESNGQREYETFAFQLPLPETDHSFEFAIHYEWKRDDGDSESVWDNNGGKNYTLCNQPNAGKKRLNFS